MSNGSSSSLCFEVVCCSLVCFEVVCCAVAVLLLLVVCCTVVLGGAVVPHVIHCSFTTFGIHCYS